MEKLKLLLVDDHEIFLDGLVSLLSDQPGVEVTGKAINGEEALSRIKENTPDILLTDLSMPGMDGIALVRKVKRDYPDIKVLVLSMHKDREMVNEIVMAEAEGYILKNTDKKELMKAINRLADGDTYYSNDIMSVMLERYQKQEKIEKSKAVLTEREQEILNHIALEMTSEEIADRLFISRRTVETHRKNILRKTNVKTIVGLIKFGFQHELITFN